MNRLTDLPVAAPEAAELLLYKQVFDNAIVGICFMRGRHFVRVNQRMEEMLGYGPGELVGQSVRMLYARAEDYEEVGRIVADFPNNNRYVHERPLVSKDGRLLWCLIAGRMVDPADPDSASVWIVQDLTAKKEMEDQLARANHRLEQTVQRRTLNLQKTNEALRAEVERRRQTERAMIESREKYRVLIRNIPLGIVITDSSGEVAEINPALQSLFGVTNLDAFVALAGRATVTVLRDGAVLGLLELIRASSPADSRRTEHSTVHWMPSDGAARWFDVVGVRVPVLGLGAAIVFYDRTEQRQARAREHAQSQQLAHATRQSLMGQFASALAHELGQPLNASLSYAAGIEHRLGAELDARPDVRDALGRIRLHLAQAGDVIRNVRAFIARHRPDEEPIDFAALCQATLDLLQIQLREAAVRVSLSVPQDLPRLSGSRVELQQVLVNLIVNAVEAMRDAGVAHPRIAIRAARARAGQVRVSVEDNGPGVTETLREQIFQPYVTSKPGGLGMGLMMCRTIVESHGGTMILDTAGRRQGARFRFTLPVQRTSDE
ncbi:MAG TPA: PAS domain S-box protein [Nevskiaceae bacterium]|nr:PAS domain S-box protein [Nevskiaceae bacterium]